MIKMKNSNLNFQPCTAQFRGSYMDTVDILHPDMKQTAARRGRYNSRFIDSGSFQQIITEVRGVTLKNQAEPQDMLGFTDIIDIIHIRGSSLITQDILFGSKTKTLK